MAQNFDGASEQLAKGRGLQLRQYAYSRLYPTKSSEFQSNFSQEISRKGVMADSTTDYTKGVTV